ALLHTAVYTHGHVDHAFGLRAFLEAGERPNIVAQANLPARFRRYALTHGLNLAINQRQFSRPNISFPNEFDHPTLTFRDSLVQRIGKTEVVYTAAKGETDDHCYLWLPEKRYLFTGDLVIWHAPNCGNPQKVQRYPVEWAEALEAMAALEPEWLFPGHGLVIEGRGAVRKLLTETAAYLRHIIEQVLTRMNAGENPEDIFHAVEAHPELSTRPYLSARYDHPKFIVRNLLRLWGGWWNGNAADLLPATPSEQAGEIAALAGGIEAVVARGRSLLEAGNAKMASHLAEWATRAESGKESAQALKRDVYERRLAEAGGTMEQGIYRSAMNEARAALGEEPVFPEGRAGFGSQEEE
ncbi:MAG: alkyl sulfatase dimerization domain-containing protein, partial [bacterium]